MRALRRYLQAITLLLPAIAESILTAPLVAAGGIDWINRLSFRGSGTSNPLALAVDRKGNVYVAGWVDGSSPNQGDIDGFLRKCDSSGREIWTRRIATLAADSAEAVAVDLPGNAYVAGWTTGA